MCASPVVDRRDVFCRGPLLHTVQMAQVFKDSKYFVDMKLKHKPAKILEKYNEFLIKFGHNPTLDQITNFVHDNFEENDREFREWDPEDWTDQPRFLNNIPDENYREFGRDLHQIWKSLGRKIKEDVKKDIEQLSLMWVPNPVIVPGGRFKEFYYWDSYWIIKGLLISEMYTTVRGMLDNYLYLVDKLGYVPNGGRIYYLGRSQPPLLIPSFKLYMDSQNDLEYLKESILYLEQEFNFWLKKRTVQIRIKDVDYILAHYGDDSEGPRPESYAEDVKFASSIEDPVKKAKFYKEVKAACESGWDFSSRWFQRNDSNKGQRLDISTSSIIPVDLNAILYGNAVILQKFHELLGNPERVEYYKKLAGQWLEGVSAVLWDKDVGVWLDYDTKRMERINFFHASNLTPLWTKCFNEAVENEVVELNLKYLEDMDILNYPGGIPQTLECTGEQWDFPNAWPPSQHIIISGLHMTNNPQAKQIAKDLASKWLISNYDAYTKTKHMSEKYNATMIGVSGGGGEYSVQFGFGWTNGVILDILFNFFSK